MLKKKRMIVGAALLAAAVAYLGFRLIRQEPPAVQIPYADLLETAALKWGLHFPDDWSVWEERIDQHLSDYYGALAKKESRKVEYFMTEYRRFWAQGADLDAAPLPADLVPAGGASWHISAGTATIKGAQVKYEPTVYVDLFRQGLVYKGGGWEFDHSPRGVQTHFESKSKEFILLDEEHYRLKYRGIPPQLLRGDMRIPKMVYIGKGGKPLPLAFGELPAEIDPAAPFKKMSGAELQLAIRQLSQIVNRPTAHQQKTLDAASTDSVDRMYVADLFGGIMEAWRERPSAWQGVSMEPLMPAASSVQKAEAANDAPETALPPAGTPYLYSDAYASPVRAMGTIYGNLNGKAQVGNAQEVYVGTGRAISSIVFADNGTDPPVVETYPYDGKSVNRTRFGNRGNDGDPSYGDALILTKGGAPAYAAYLIARTYCPWDRFWLWLKDPARYSISSEASAQIQDYGKFAETPNNRESAARYP